MLVLMGSGETTPPMVTLHRLLAGQLGPAPDAVLLNTPYGFQENAAAISQKAAAYFAGSVGLPVRVGRAEDVLGADWVFAGPGSPTYALRRWRADGTAAALRERMLTGSGVTVLASAAACLAGARTLPVYEVYKAGADPHWQAGLDLLPVIGLPATVIPHYDNTEGGTHDTRFCYLGERRLVPLQRELPAPGAVLGVDEHTAVVLDLVAGTASVHGRGGLTVRRLDGSTVLPAGTTLPIGDLAAALTGGPVELPAAPAVAPSVPAALLGERVAACRAAFDAAVDGPGMARAVLDLEDAVATWAADTEEDDEDANAARPLLRGLIGRLGRAVDRRTGRTGLVDDLVGLRADLRRSGRFAEADRIRALLTAAGVTVHDDRDGTRWSVSGPP